MHDGKTIYRVAVEGLHCRSSRELVNISFSKLAGVEASAIDDRNVLTVFADATVVRPSDVVRTLIATGFVPGGEVWVADASVLETVVADDTAEADVVEDAEEVQVVAEVVTDAAVAAEVAAPVSALTDEPAEADVETAYLLIDAIAEVPTEAATEALPATVAVATDEFPAGGSDPTWSPQEAFEAPVTHASPQASLVQRIHVEVSDNYYPNRIDVVPGVPVEIEFGEGHGCLAHVLFEDFDIDQDLTQAGAVVRLPGLAPGEYRFSCGMRMVFGKVVARS